MYGMYFDTLIECIYILYVMCFYIMLKHNVWYHIFYCSVNRNYRELHSATATEQPYTFAHTELDETTQLYASCCQAVQILLLQRSCKPFIVSSVTLPCIKKYICGQDPLVLCVSEFFKLNCWVAFGRQSPWDVVARPFR